MSFSDTQAKQRPFDQFAAPQQPVPFIDLQAQRRRLGDRIDQALARVFDHGGFVFGAEVSELENRLAAFAGVPHCVSCANGTDALSLVLMAWEIGPGDAVFVPAFTFVATAQVVAREGATPVFVDIDETSFNMDPASLAAAIDVARKQGLTPRAVIAVDLFGQVADYGEICAVAAREGMKVLADAAQSFGASRDGMRVGNFGDATTTSFFPAKPLGCYGDGGAILTRDPKLAETLKSLRMHGQGVDRYEHVRIGMNSRLDALQAAVLLAKLEVFEEEIIARQLVAARYAAGLPDACGVPSLVGDCLSVWAQYTLQPREGVRGAIMAACKAQGIPTMIYYPTPLNQQAPYRQCPVAPGGVPVSEDLAKRVVSLPMHPYLDRATQDRIIMVVSAAFDD